MYVTNFLYIHTIICEELLVHETNDLCTYTNVCSEIFVHNVCKESLAHVANDVYECM